jgi:hypothetical protein
MSKSKRGKSKTIYGRPKNLFKWFYLMGLIEMIESSKKLWD